MDDAYILNETGAQVDKVTGLFTKDESTTAAEKAFAQLNIGTAGSNRNLLDNPWFTVNQRGFTSGNMGALVYWADRWMNNTDTTNPSTLSLNNGIVTITTPSGTGRFGNILQTLADPNAIDGKVVTLSALKSDGTIISGTITRTAATTQDAYNEGGIILRLSSTNRFNVQVESGKTLSIKAAKLELGTVSTLANDTPPDYGTELIKCRGYFERIHSLGSSEIVGMGMGVSASSVRIGIPSLICHTIQSVTYSGGGLLLEGGGNYRTLTSIGRLNTTPKNGFLTLTCGSSDAITPYQTYALVGTAAGGYIDISADL